MAFGPRGLVGGGVGEVAYRGILLNSRPNSSYTLYNSPISELSVTWGVALVAGTPLPSFKLGEVGIEFLFLSMHLARCWLAYSYS